MHGAAQITKAENQILMLHREAISKTTSAQNPQAPFAVGNLRTAVLAGRKAWPIPTTLLRSIPATGMKRFKFNDVCFFLTNTLFFIRLLHLRPTPIPDKQLYKRMMSAFHFMLLLYFSYEANKFDEEIALLAEEYIECATLFHGHTFTSFLRHNLAHIAEDVYNHGPSMTFSSCSSELMFKTVRDTIGCYHQQASRLANRRFYLTNIDITSCSLKRGRWTLLP